MEKKSDELNVCGSFVLVRVCLGMCVGMYVIRYLCLRKNIVLEECRVGIFYGHIYRSMERSMNE